jgi:hypothetical protein
MLLEGKISRTDMDLILCTDDPDEVVKVIADCYEQGCADFSRIALAGE